MNIVTSATGIAAIHMFVETVFPSCRGLGNGCWRIKHKMDETIIV